MGDKLLKEVYKIMAEHRVEQFELQMFQECNLVIIRVVETPHAALVRAIREVLPPELGLKFETLHLGNVGIAVEDIKKGDKVELDILTGEVKKLTEVRK